VSNENPKPLSQYIVNLNRRSFIKTAGSIALASVAGSLPAFSSPQRNTQRHKARVAVLFKPGFPSLVGVLVFFVSASASAIVNQAIVNANAGLKEAPRTELPKERKLKRFEKRNERMFLYKVSIISASVLVVAMTSIYWKDCGD
jgi:hypothetical protein